MKRWRRLRRLLACGALCAASSSAQAQYRHRVLLLQHPDEDAESHEITTRVRGELGAAGFDVLLLPTQDPDPQRAVESAGRDMHPAGVLLIERLITNDGGKRQATGTELWLSDRMLRKTVVLRLRSEDEGGAGGATRIAVQAVELIKARLAELALTRENQPQAPPAGPPVPIVIEIERRGPRPNLTAGVALLEGFQKGQDALMPVLRLGVGLPERFTGDRVAIEARGSFAGLGEAARIERGPVAAKLRHTIFGLDAVARFFPKGPVQPFVALGAGLLVLDVVGDAPEPYRNSASRTRSGLVNAGGGVWLQPLPGFGVTLEGQVLGAWSKTVVRIVSEDAGEVAAPLLLLSGGLMVQF
jgi:hypothetical protein